MSDDLYSNIIRQLADIEWGGELCFHRYNEPLYDRDYIIKRLTEARTLLPHAILKIFTNGDYLDALYAAGCRAIEATAHIEPEHYTDDHAHDVLNKRIQNLGLHYVEVSSELGIQYQVQGPEDLDFIYRAYNFGGTAKGVPVRQDRGQSLTVNETVRRTAPCIRPFDEMQIETDGTMMPCCNFRSDVQSHKQYAIGKLTAESDLFAAWTSENYVAWRKGLVTNALKTGACASCAYGVPDEDDLRFEAATQAAAPMRYYAKKFISKIRGNGLGSVASVVAKKVIGH